MTSAVGASNGASATLIWTAPTISRACRVHSHMAPSDWSNPVWRDMPGAHGFPPRAQVRQLWTRAQAPIADRTGRRMAAHPAYETIKLEIGPDKVGIITMNRPEALNAMTTQMMRELRDCFMQFYIDPNQA